MNRSFRTLSIAAILVAGIAYTPPVQLTGTTQAGAAPAGAVDPGFHITARRGSLAVAGHTRSARHETLLRELAAKHYPDYERTFDFRPLGLAPDWWTDVTTELLVLMSSTISPSARLTADTLTIDAIVPDGIAAGSQHRALFSPQLPAAVRLQSRLAPAGPTLSKRELCERLFREFRAGPVHFAGYGTTLRPSAYPVLDRIALLADTCRGATVTVTGHTDARGSDAWNRQLSLDRARAVAAYLVERGITADDIVAVGAGSKAPVADNSTRYGRSLNRRIEVNFSYDPASSGDVSLTSSISNSSVALGGTGGLPRSP